jgi:2-iminobutanoate/2-iminopropanoate deaminase
MTVKRWNPAGVAPPLAFYSHLAEAPAGARVVAMSGQVGNREDGSIPDGLEAQFEAALDNITALAAAAGKDQSAVMKLIVLLTEPPTDGARIGAAMEKSFPGPKPAMTWIYVAGLARPNLKVEIDVTLAV